MDLLNKKYLEPKLDEQPETASSQSPEKENTAGEDLTEPTSQIADIAISQRTDNADATDLNSDDVQRSINADGGGDVQSIKKYLKNITEGVSEAKMTLSRFS